MSLVKPHRSPGESTVMWISRRDSYRLSIIEEQIGELQIEVKKLARHKK